jgi:hypothetical protein
VIHGNQVGRAALELTAGEVQGTDLDTRYTLDGMVTVEVTLTMGTLTAAMIRLYAGSAATPTNPLHVNGVAQVYRLTAAGTYEFVVNAAGCRYFRASAQGDAGFAGSSCTVNYRYNDYRTVIATDGVLKEE